MYEVIVYELYSRTEHTTLTLTPDPAPAPPTTHLVKVFRVVQQDRTHHNNHRHEVLSGQSRAEEKHREHARVGLG